MRTRLQIAALAALVLLAWVAWRVGSSSASEPIAPDEVARVAREEAVAAAEAELGPVLRDDKRSAVELESPPTLDRASLSTRPSGALTVEVQLGGAPRPGARVALRADAEPTAELARLVLEPAAEQVRTTDAEGRAHFEALPYGRCDVRAELSDAEGERFSARAFVAVREEERTLRLELAPEPPLLVRVLDDAGRTLAGAAVELTVGLERARDDSGTELLRGTTDAEGEARFADRRYVALLALARASDGRAGTAIAWTRSGVERALRRGGLEVVVGAPARLAGRLTGLAPEELAGSRVLARLLTTATPHYTAHGREFATEVRDGSYAFEALAPGRYTLALDDPRGARLRLPPLDHGGPLENSVDPLHVELAAGARVQRDLEIECGATLEGSVGTTEGEPLPGARVRVSFAPLTSNFPDGFVLRGAHVWRFDSPGSGDDDHPDAHWRARTGADGRYRITGLPAGRVRVEVQAQGRAYDRREGVQTRGAEVTRLEHALALAGSIRGLAPGINYLGLVAEGDQAPRMLAILPGDGAFHFAGLEVGVWMLAAFHSDSNVAPVPLSSVTVHAGRETWIDLGREVALPVRIGGRVVDARGPVAGARVRKFRDRALTDSDGRFEFREAFSATMTLEFEVELRGQRTEFAFEPMQAGQQDWQAELELGRESLVVRTLDADGREAPATLSLWVDAVAGGPARRTALADARVEGALTLAGLLPGTARISAVFDDGVRAEVSVELPHGEPLELRAPQTGTLEVEVRRADGSAAPDATVWAMTWIGDGPAPAEPELFREAGHSVSGRTGPDGTIELRGVRVGEVLLQAYEERPFLEAAEAPPSRRLSMGRNERVRVEYRLR